MRTWFISDTHFNHANVLNFRGDDGTPIRPGFSSIHEMNQTIMDKWNNVVADEDMVVHMGDVLFGGANIFLDIMLQLKGRKKLIRGNHDEQKMSLYMDVFNEVLSFYKPSHHKIVFTHIPVHPDSIPRWCINVHGHTHQRNVKWRTDAGIEDDPRYLNLSIERTDYAPILFEQIVEQCEEKRRIAWGGL